jgi:hypothetical protein
MTTFEDSRPLNKPTMWRKLEQSSTFIQKPKGDTSKKKVKNMWVNI